MKDSNETLALATQEETVPAIAPKGRRFTIPGDTVNRATADLEDEERTAIRWLHAYAWENDFALKEIAGLLRKRNGDPYNEHSIYSVFTGRHDADKGNFVRAILDFKEVLEKRKAIRRIPFVDTTLAQKVFKFCQVCFDYQKIGFLFGESQIGKSVTLKKYRDDHNHGETIYVSMPTGGYFGKFVNELAKTLRIATELSTTAKMQRIFTSFDDRMLLIVDEVHQSFITKEGNTRVLTLEFIREIHDKCGCGIVLCGTQVFEHAMQEGRHAKLLKQLSNRALPEPLRLPAKPLKSDLDKINAKYDLDAPTGAALELQNNVIKERGLGAWFTYLQAGSKVAADRKKPIRWEHVLAADAAFRAFGNFAKES